MGIIAILNKDKFECRSEAQKAYSEFVPRDFIQDAVYESKKNNFYKECMEARGYEMKETIKTQCKRGIELLTYINSRCSSFPACMVGSARQRHEILH